MVVVYELIFLTDLDQNIKVLMKSKSKFYDISLIHKNYLSSNPSRDICDLPLLPHVILDIKVGENLIDSS